MHALAPGISVNGIVISPEQISAEVQYHPAPTLFDAKYEAMQALVIRELLIQEAVKQGVTAQEQAALASDKIIDRLLKKELTVPDPSPEECQRYYKNNSAKFHTSPLFEVSHILYLAPPEDNDARLAAKGKAEQALKSILANPENFKKIAMAESACSSAKQGGHLGQISKGQTMPAFEAALMKMKAGEINATPVASEVGYHIIQLHERAEGNLLPYEAVADWIGQSLKEQSWRRALSQYIQILAGKAQISGFRLRAADNPLVQ